MEHELQGHTKKVYRIWNDPRKKLIEKLKDIALEIAIIVFAVTISIWFHSWSQHKHEQKDVKAFLIGLKDDLKSDLKEIKSDQAQYKGYDSLFRLIQRSTKNNGKINKDSIMPYRSYVFSTTGLNVNDGRFDGFKSSGKIGLIENEDLQNDILNLYEENIPTLIMNSKGYTEKKSRFIDDLMSSFKRTGSDEDNMLNFLNGDVSYSYARSLSDTKQIVELYQKVADQNSKIIAKIDKMYDLK